MKPWSRKSNLWVSGWTSRSRVPYSHGQQRVRGLVSTEVLKRSTITTRLESSYKSLAVDAVNRTFLKIIFALFAASYRKGPPWAGRVLIHPIAPFLAQKTNRAFLLSQIIASFSRGFFSRSFR